MKKSLLYLPLMAALIGAGCCGINYQATQVTTQGTNTITINAQRFIWSTESYVAVIGTNGTGSLTASKSSVDTVALGQILSAVSAATGATPK